MQDAESDGDREQWVIGVDRPGESLSAELQETRENRGVRNGVQGMSKPDMIYVINC